MLSVRPQPRIAAALIAALALLPAACGGDDEHEIGTARVEQADAPADPGPGWHTVRNRPAGFTVSVPNSWTDTETRERTVIRSDDHLVAIPISADRSERGKKLSAESYALRTIHTLPHFAGIVGKRVSRVPGSKYESAMVSAIGTVAPSNLSQRITVAVFHRPGQVTYGALIFRNAGVKPGFNGAKINRILRSFRAQQPDSR
jgi:hypothetical protein